VILVNIQIFGGYHQIKLIFRPNLGLTTSDKSSFSIKSKIYTKFYIKITFRMKTSKQRTVEFCQD